MAQPASTNLDSDATHILQLTCVTSQQDRSPMRQADAPSLEIRNIRTTQNPPQWYISRGGDYHEPEPASDNAYFALEAVEYNHVLITLNDKGELCIQDTSVLGGVSISGRMLEKSTPTTLPPSGEIGLMRCWNPITCIWRHELTLKATVCLASSASPSIEDSLTPRAQRQSLLENCVDTDAERASDATPTTPCGRKSQSNSTQEKSRSRRGARKRSCSQAESDNDTIQPSRRDKFPRLASCPDVHRRQESLPSGRWPDVCSTRSQQDHDMGASPARISDCSLTRSRSNMTRSSEGDEPSTPPELRYQRPLSERAKEEFIMYLCTPLYTGSDQAWFRVRAYPYIKRMLGLGSILRSDPERYDVMIKSYFKALLLLDPSISMSDLEGL